MMNFGTFLKHAIILSCIYCIFGVIPSLQSPPNNEYIHLFNQITHDAMHEHTYYDDDIFDHPSFDDFDKIAKYYLGKIIKNDGCNTHLANDHAFLHNLFLQNEQIQKIIGDKAKNVDGSVLIKMIIVLKIRYNSVFGHNELLSGNNTLRNFMAAFECIEKMPNQSDKTVDEAMEYVMDLNIYPYVNKANDNRENTIEETNRIYWNGHNPNHKKNFDMLQGMFHHKMTAKELHDVLTQIHKIFTNPQKSLHKFADKFMQIFENIRENATENHDKLVQNFVKHLMNRIDPFGKPKKLQFGQMAVKCQFLKFGKGLAERSHKNLYNNKEYRPKFKEFANQFLKFFSDEGCFDWDKSPAETKEFMLYEPFIGYHDILELIEE